MDATHLTEVIGYVSDVIETDGGTATHIGITDAADGSGRTVAILTIADRDHEQTYRVFSPAPWNSPEWASVYLDWIVQVHVGGANWMTLEREPA